MRRVKLVSKLRVVEILIVDVHHVSLEVGDVLEQLEADGALEAFWGMYAADVGAKVGGTTESTGDI